MFRNAYSYTYTCMHIITVGKGNEFESGEGSMEGFGGRKGET